MNRLLPILLLILCPFFLRAKNQNTVDTTNQYVNSAQRLMETDGNLTIGGYGEIHYNQPLDDQTYQAGKLDVHRMVLLVGYRFNERTQFITELEFEHVKEVYVEQAFMQYKLNDYINLRGGLMLIPMGIVNEYHEPTTFNGVERPLVDKYIAPSTWREIGIGATGNIIPASIRYQAYIVNGFNGYDGVGKLNGKNGLRKGRQKGAESYITSPNLTAKVEYYGIKGLNLGLSGYFGKTQSTLFNGLDKDDPAAIAMADSSVVGVSMIGIDGRYNAGGWQFRGQLYLSSLYNTDQYNHFTGSDGTPNDLGSSMNGYYIEAGYNVFKKSDKIKTELIPFVRLEGFNTHRDVESDFTQNKAYDQSLITGGLTWRLSPGAVVKADMQWLKSEATDDWSKTFNAGIGIMF